MKDFSIELANSSRTYTAGEVVQGRVIIQNEKPFKVKEVALVLEGTGRVHWSLTETFPSSETKTLNGQVKHTPLPKKQARVYSETEKYVSQRMSLAGDGQNTMTLPIGSTIYPFQFVLPKNCPSSFTTKYGYVAYSLQAEIRRPMLRKNKKMAVPFTVHGMVDLNSEQGASQPQQLQKVRGSNLFACRTGQLRFLLQLPRSGFVPGEILDFSSEITNSSNRRVSSVKASLHQVIQYQARMKTKTERWIIDTVTGPELEAGEHEIWKPNSIRIPTLPPTRLGGMCRIINVQYYLRFEISISGLSKGLSGELPVMIGTMPLDGVAEGIAQASTPQPCPHGQSQEMGTSVQGCSNNEQDFAAICDNNDAERYSWSVTNDS